MTKFLFLGSFLFLFVFSLFASIPIGYYNSIEGKKTAALKTALHDIICQDTTHYLGYGSGKGKTWEGFYSTDRNMTTNAVIDMYSDSVRYFPNPNPDFVSFGQTIHIEHSLPKSWWGCDITHPDCPAKDLHQLYPADGPTNSSKNDDPLGVVSGTPTYNNGVSKIGPATYSGYTGAVFEPADQYKGDFARSYFYMATAYEHYAAKWDTTKPENMMENNTYPVFKPWAVQLLLQWSRQDPVSEKEITRDETVYSIQQNRNPFIDHPELIEYIWGNKTSVPYTSSTTAVPFLTVTTNVVLNNTTLNFNALYTSPVTRTFNILGNSLQGDIIITKGGSNPDYFSISATDITKENATTGTAVSITYTPPSLRGNYTATMNISSTNAAAFTINLVGNN